MEEPYTVNNLLTQLALTNTSLKKHVDAIKSDIDGLDEFLLEHKKSTQQKADSAEQSTTDL